jgi:DNA replication licensing factor MCM2
VSPATQAETTYRNYQKITLQESPGTVPAGRVPRYKEVILTADLIDRARPGEEIDVTGVYMHRSESSLNRNGFPVFSTCILANCIQKREDMYSMYHITDDDKAEIHRLAQDPNIARRLLK